MLNSMQAKLRRLFLGALILASIVSISSIGISQRVVGTDPQETADQAIIKWLNLERPTFENYQNLGLEAACKTLPDAILNPPPLQGTEVNLNDSRAINTGDPTVLKYTYSATLPRNRLEIVQVTLKRSEGKALWEATKVGYWIDDNQTGRRWLQGSLPLTIFSAFSLFVLYLTITKSILRKWLEEGLRVLRSHKRLVIGTLLGLYSMFFLGSFLGSQLPSECRDPVVTLIETTITAVGATEAYGSGNVVRAATVTFYQNFVVVAASLTGTFALLFGIPAYVLSASSFFIQGIPFGLLGAFSGPNLLFVLILVFLELTAYFLVVAGGGILLATIIRRGFRSYPIAAKKLFVIFPIVLLLLLIAAWYEALFLIQFFK